jgi:hypothetical protein
MIIKDIQHTQSFELAYEFIKVFGDEIEVLKIAILNKTSLKSNHYWLMAILPKLKNLKVLKLYRENDGVPFDNQGYKFLSKAMNYFQKNGGDLKKIQMHRTFYTYSANDNLYQFMKYTPNIQVLDFSNNTLQVTDCKGIGKILSDFKFVKELNVKSTLIGAPQAKEIADGLMRAK